MTIITIEESQRQAAKVAGLSYVLIVARLSHNQMIKRQNHLGQNYLILFLMLMNSCNTKGLKARSQND